MKKRRHIRRSVSKFWEVISRHKCHLELRFVAQANDPADAVIVECIRQTTTVQKHHEQMPVYERGVFARMELIKMLVHGQRYDCPCTILQDSLPIRLIAV